MSVITIIQIIISIALVALILVQENSSGAGGVFGGGGGGGFHQTRRGLEKILHISTIILVVIFAGLAILSLII